MRRRCCLALLTWCAVVQAQQPGPDPVAPPTNPLEGLAVRDLEERLLALTPDRPQDYFDLAEEVASEATEPEQVSLATTLYVLSFEIDRRRRDGRLGASACVALADLSRLSRERSWLLALAGALDPRYAQPDWSRVDPVRVSDETAYLAVTAVSYVRSGEGRRARDLLSNPAVLALIRRYEALLSPVGLPGMADVLAREAQRWPCPECGFDRISRKAGSVPPEYVACHTCGGNPGMRLSTDEFIAHLRFESTVLEGVQRSWSAQVATDAGRPLRDPDPDELAPTLGVDATRNYWRDGRWVSLDPPVKAEPRPSTPEAPAPLPERVPESSSSAS